MQTTTLMNEKEAAEVLRLSPRTLQSWRVSGGGPTYRKLGRAVRYDRAQLDAWIAARSTAHTAAAQASPAAIR